MAIGPESNRREPTQIAAEIKIRADILISEMPDLLQRFFKIVPWSLWSKRIAELKRIANAAGDLSVLGEAYELEFALDELMRYRRTHEGAFPPRARSNEEFALYAFIATFCEVHDALWIRPGGVWLACSAQVSKTITGLAP